MGMKCRYRPHVRACVSCMPKVWAPLPTLATLRKPLSANAIQREAELAVPQRIPQVTMLAGLLKGVAEVEVIVEAIRATRRSP